MTEVKKEPNIVSIKLVKPHTHAGRDYPAETQLVLAEVGLSQTDAAWLIAIGVADAAA